MIQAQQLVKQYHDIRVVDDVSFSVAAGQTMVLLGESGSGKTTTLKMINRLVEPSAGTVWLDGKDIRQMNPVQLRRQIGYVIQENGLFPHYSVRENIGIVPRLLKWNPTKIEQRVHEVLESLELSPTEVAGKYPHELSGGQQQRIAIARAIAAQPPLLLMDEPFSALDPITRAGVRTSFRALCQRLGITVVLVTHDVAEAIELGDRICLMKAGKIVQQGTAKELVFEPQHAFVRSFFAHSRLESELKVLRPADLLTYLPGSPRPDTPQVNVPLSLSFYRILEQYGTAGTALLSLVDEQGQHYATATFSQLLAAFYKHKEAKVENHGR